MVDARTDESGETLRIWLFGGFRLIRGTREIAAAEWRLRKARNLIKLLALTPGHRLHREQVMEALWPHLEVAAAINNLRKVLHVARRVLGSVGTAPAARDLVLQDEVLSFSSDTVWVDVDAFERDAERAQRSRDIAAYERALSYGADDLLPEDLYEEWSRARREELRQKHLTLLADLGSAYESTGANVKAIETLQRLLSRDTTREEAHRSLMRLYASTGRRQQALRQYQLLRESLAREMDAEPDTESQRLYATIVAGKIVYRSE